VLQAAQPNDLGAAFRDAERLNESIARHDETLKLRTAKLGPDHPDTLISRINLAEAYQATGRLAKAEPLLRDLLEHQGMSSKLGSPDLAAALAGLGRTLLLQGKGPEAEPVLRESLTIREKAIPDDWRRFNTMSQLGGALLGQRRYAEAEPLVVPGYEGMKAREARIPAPSRPRLADAAVRVVRLYDAWGKPEKATEWKSRLGLADLPADVFARP
jgi:tetratricopeptide (TPR) repeat protein